MPITRTLKNRWKKKAKKGKKADISKVVATFAPGWKIRDCGNDMKPGLRKEWGGRKNVLLTHPLSQETPCILSRSLDVPEAATLRLTVRDDNRGDFKLVVKVNGKEVLQQDIADSKWQDIEIDLSKYAGQTVKLEHCNQAAAGTFEAADGGRIVIGSTGGSTGG